MKLRSLSICLLWVLLPGVWGAEPWNRFRGPDGTGRTAATVPRRWSEWHNIRWKTPLPGRGWSSPVLAGDCIWLTTGMADGRSLRALCVNLGTGALEHNVEVFAPEIPEIVHKVNSHATPTPVTEPGRVYVSFGNQGTACLNADTGAIFWRNRDLRLDHKEGPGSSPILWHDLLILECDGIDVQYIVALNKVTGKEVWRTERTAPFQDIRSDQRKAYGTPVVLDIDGQSHLISCGSRRFYGYDPATGKERWTVDHPGYNCAQTPLTALGTIILGTGFNRGRLMAVPLSGAMTGNITDTHTAWTLERDVPRIPSPLVFQDRLFLMSDGGVASWVDAESGRQIWRDKVLGKVYASPVSAGNAVLVFDERGDSVVFEIGEVPAIVATNQLAEGCLATPAIVEDSLIVRTKTHLYRIQAR